MPWAEAKAAGNAAYSEGRTDDAIKAWSEALSDDSLDAAQRATILSNRAQAYLKLGRNESAIEDCTACLTHQPNNVKAMFRRAAAYEALKDHKEALRDYKAVLAVDANVADAAAGARRCEAALGLTPSTTVAKGKGKSSSSSSGGRGGPAISEEDARMLTETETRVKEVQKQRLRATEQKRVAEQEKRRAELTLNQVGSLPEDKKLYRSVGRAYVLASKPAITAQLTEASAKAESRLKVCSLTLDHLAKQEKEADAAFLELWAQIRRRASA